MFGKNDLHEAIELELKILEHLYQKLPRENWQGVLAYRPSEDQRSLLELLRYLSYCGIGGCLAALEGGWEGYGRVAKRGEAMAAEEFPEAMARQRQEIAEVFAGLSEEDFATRQGKNPVGQAMPLTKAFYEVPIRWLIGYRMQLFLYARAVGADVWTPDCWYGVHRDRPAKS